MWISTREAAERMAGIGIDRETARRGLAAGIAGPALKTRGAHLYEEARIEQVMADATRPERPVDDCVLDGVFVGRLSARRVAPGDDWREWRGADLTAPRDEQLLAASGWWRMSAITVMVMRLRAQREGFVPFLGTVSGLAVVGAEIVGLESEAVLGRPGRVRFQLRPAGPWVEPLAGRLMEGPAGSPWYRWPRPFSIDS